MKSFLLFYHHIPRVVRQFLIVAIFATIPILLIYSVAVKIIRGNADSPQIELSQDSARLLSHNYPMGPVVPDLGVEISESLNPFIQIYDEKGSVVDGNGFLHSKTPKIPKGVLDHTKENDEHRLTWAPEKDVRIATVITPFKGETEGYVLVGRSLTETENQIGNIGELCLLWWLGILLALTSWFFYPLLKKH